MKNREASVIKSMGNRHVAIDAENESEIKRFVGQSDAYKKKFRQIVDAILNNLNVPELFDKEDINDKCKDVWAMKFFKNGKGSTANGRLYCKKVKDGDDVTVIIASEVLWKKKNQKNQSTENNLIQKVAGYQFNINYEKPEE